MGEEVGHYNGAYKVTQGLLQRFSERRVIDAPIAEMGFAGIGVGAAMVGLRPIIEFMTFNFSLVAIDQIVNNAAKIYQMSGGQFNVPIVFRGPGGPAVQVGSQHSQSLESFYAHVPGPQGRDAVDGVRREGPAEDGDPRRQPGRVHRGRDALQHDVGGPRRASDHLIPIGKADVKREGKDVTLIAWSKMVWTCLDAAKALAEEGIECEVVDPRTLRPLDVETLADERRARPAAA